MGIKFQEGGNQNEIFEQPQDFTARNKAATITGWHLVGIDSYYNNLVQNFSVLVGGCGGGQNESESNPTTNNPH